MKLVIILLGIHFVLGAAGIALVNRNQDRERRRSGWIKFLAYLGLTTIVISAVAVHIFLFIGLCIAIFSAGIIEVLRTANLTSLDNKTGAWKVRALVALALSASFFSVFILLPLPLVITTYVAVVIFDGASQVLGQLFGKRKILPVLSPGKTIEGLAGGTLSAVTTTVILHDFAGLPPWQAAVFGLIICLASFAGDAAASSYKRAFGIKDFGRILPGQGGILDRYDSFIASGATVGILSLFFSNAFPGPDRNIAAYLGYSVAYMIILMSAEAIYAVYRIRSEYLRIATHVLCGLTSLFIPLFFSSAWYVVCICLQSAAFVFLTKRMNLLDSHHNVERTTNGSSFFFIGLLISYLVSQHYGDASIFYISAMVLTVSDPLAAISGFTYRGRRLVVPGAAAKAGKTFIGSLAFFLSAFVIVAYGVRIFYSYPASECLIISLMIAGSSMLAEAFSHRGTDNISIPLMVSVLLSIVAN